MAHYYINPNYQCHPPNYYSYDDQPYYSDHHNNFNYNYNYNYSSSSYVDHQLDYGGYANPEQFPVRYDQYQYYNSQFHSNPYQVLPSKSLIVYHNYNSAGYDNHPEFPAKKGSNFVDPDLSTGFVVAYSETTPNTDLDFEEYNPEPFQGGYNMTETYGKPLPPSEDICYPPAKFDLTPPPPSPFGKGDKNVDHPTVKPQENNDEEEDEDHISDSEDTEDEDEDEEDEEEEDEEEEEEKDNHGGVLIAPPLLGKEGQKTDQGGANLANGRLGSPVHKASPQVGEANVSFINEKTRKEEQPLKPEQEEDEDEDEEDEEDDEEEEEEEEEKEEKRVSWDDGRVEEKEIRRQIPPGYGLEALDLCEGVFGGYFPCLRKRNQGNVADQGGNNSVSYGSEDAYGDCWKTTMDYLFGDPNPYARAMPDPVYGYQRYYPQQPISEQVQYGGDYTWSTNSEYYYGYNNGEGY